MKNFLKINRALVAKKKITFLFALLCASVMGFAINWNNYQWLGDGAGGGAYSNKYKVAPAEGQNVVNIQQPGWSAEAGIYTSDFGGAISSCSLGDKCAIDGGGVVLYLSAFTMQETEVTVVAALGTKTFTVYYVDGTPSGAPSKGDPALTLNSYTETLSADAPAETFQIVASQSGDGAISYGSSNAGIASVSNTGLVTAVGRGTATITVSTAETDAYEADSETLTVTVTGPINWDAVSWLGNSDNKYKMIVNPSTGINIVNVQERTAGQGIYIEFPSAAWGACSLNSDDYETQGAARWFFLSAFPYQYNEFTQVCAGTTYTFNVYYADGTSGGPAVKEDPELTLNSSAETLDASVPETFQIVPSQIGDGAISYESSNANIASVDNNGLVTAVARGTATITVSVAATDAYLADSKTLTIIVTSPINWDELEWIGNGSGVAAYTEKYKILAADGQSVVNIQKPGFADEAGIYTSFSAGISACSLPDGKYAIQGGGIVLYMSAFSLQETAVTITAGDADYTCFVYYADGTPSGVPVKADPELTLNSSAETLDASVPETFQIVPSQIGDGAISYESSNANIASVSGTGLITAVGRGTATITVSVAATDDYAADSKTLTVTVTGPINWGAIEWLGDGAGGGAYAEKYKLFAADGQAVVNIQQPGFADEAGIYTTFGAGISACSLPDGKYAIQGAGMVLYLSAFTARETAVTVTADNVDYECYVYYAEGSVALTFNDGESNAAKIEAYDQAIVNATISRTFPNTNEWYTLCLPFDLSDAQLTEVFGAGYTLAELKSSEDRGSLIHLNFDYVRALEAGKAYMLRPGTGVDAVPTFEGVTIKNVNPANEASECTHMSFQGTFDKITLNQDNQRFVGPENYLYSPAAGGTNMKAFRCYFTIPAGSSAPGRQAMIVFGPQTATGCENIATPEMPSKFMLNGVLYIIRDGKTYNAQGQIVK